MLKMDVQTKPKSDIKTYVKGFHIEANISGLRMPLFYSKVSATGELQTFISLEDTDVYETAQDIAGKLTTYLSNLKKLPRNKYDSISRADFQRMFALDLLTLCSRKQFDALNVEAIEFFTQLFLNSFVESNLITKEIVRMQRGTERFNRTSYKLV
jgi:hypothetical protein